MAKMTLVWGPASGREFCAGTTGHDRTTPWWANDLCPRCGEEWFLNDDIVAAETDDGETVIFHEECYKEMS